MDYIIAETDKPNLYRFYPVPMPDGDFGIDHNLVWVAPEIRAESTDDMLSAILVRILERWIAGCELPLILGCVSADIEIEPDRLVISIDYMDWEHGHAVEDDYSH